MQSAIALALIKQLVANGALDTADIQAITRHLPETDALRVKAAWLEGMTASDGPDLRVVLKIVE